MLYLVYTLGGLKCFVGNNLSFIAEYTVCRTLYFYCDGRKPSSSTCYRLLLSTSSDTSCIAYVRSISCWCGKREAQNNWSMERCLKKGNTRYWNYLEEYWPCAGGLSAVNASGTELHDPMNSGLTRWRLTSEIDSVVESGRKERNPVSKHHIQPGC